MHTKKDNTLRTLTTILTVLFLLIAFRSAYANYSQTPCDGNFFLLGMNTVWIFALYEAPFLLAIYVAGPMLSEAMPDIWILGKKIWGKIRPHRSAKTVTQVKEAVISNATVRLALPPYEQTEEHTDTHIESQEIIDCVEVEDADALQEVSNITTELSEEIINYTYGTFENVMTTEQIEKLLDNFRNLNNGGPYEKIEKKKLKDVFEFDLAHFAWNVCRRIHDPKVCPLIFTTATAVLVKDSFPITLINYDVKTLQSRLRDSYPTTKFRLPIIELYQPLEPYYLGKSDNTEGIEI